ncbi:MAG TPA: homoserine dehydrogenase, partial [Candidatus Binatia bacterium]|nr:homoserine dehydrogenase [Candidatus Binatia bacterium]
MPAGLPVRVGLIGFGTIGTGVVKLLRAHRAEIARRAGRPIVLTTIADVDLDTDRGVATKDIRLTHDARALVGDPDIDVVIELIGGYEPARRFVLEAIAHGKDVVTANKALLAVHGEEIAAAAERAGVRLGFEASVGGGIPILRTLKEGLAGDRTTAVYGIVNGTCNHILTTMTREGRGFDDVLAEAQRLGLAEANPATDIDGVDSAHKLALLTTLAFGVRPRFADIPTEGIRHVDAVDIAFARELGYTIKLLAIAKDGERDIEARVHPTMIPNGHLLADVGGNFNALFVRGAALGPTMYYGQGAGAAPTATAVVADLVAAARD